MNMSATYSPEDNKLRLYPEGKLSDADYQAVKAAGFAWAPRQKLFVAGMWTPQREDLLLSLCGSIEAEESTVAERAAERAERFEAYTAKRAQEANQAHRANMAIGQRFEGGQPILIGHHSERRARRDQERMHALMRRSVSLWETAEYWQRRAQGVQMHADYSAQPDVRARRIKTIEADKRKRVRDLEEAQQRLALVSRPGLTRDQALQVFNVMRCGYYRFPLTEYPREAPASQYEGEMSLWSALEGNVCTVEQAVELAIEGAQAVVEWSERWIRHYDNRLSYERAMLGQQIGVTDPGERWAFEPGGRIRCGRTWATIVRVNMSNGKPVSLSTNARLGRVRGVEEVDEYEAPSAEDKAAAAAATERGPLTNQPEGCISITAAQWDKVPKDYRGHRTIKATAEHGTHRVRIALGCHLPEPADFATAYPTNEAKWGWRHHYHPVFIADARRVAIPAPKAEAAPALAPVEHIARAAPAPAPAAPSEVAQGLREARELAAAGVQVVAAPQLFPTPATVAVRVAELAGLRPGDRVLEPSAGTGNLIAAALAACPGVTIEAVEHVEAVSRLLRVRFAALHASGEVSVRCGDFLEYQPDQLGAFDAVLMNPPFGKAEDIKHVKHALRFLKPGGRLVGICAGGPRQAEALRDLADTWEDLPSGTFEGTGVRSVLFTIPATAAADLLAA